MPRKKNVSFPPARATQEEQHNPSSLSDSSEKEPLLMPGKNKRLVLEEDWEGLEEMASARRIVETGQKKKARGGLTFEGRKLKDLSRQFSVKKRGQKKKNEI